MSAPHVIVGLSGGVDSAVAAWRLKEQGYRVSALFMQNWTEDEQAYCTAAEDFQSARAVADELGIPLHRVDFAAEYRERVFRHFLDAYRAGRTPNPDLLCNREVKFQPFREHALRLGADFVATGHYAQLSIDADGLPVLRRSVTEDKDQTYFLALVARSQFERVLFPIGDLTKPQVRDLARQAGLPNHRRKDSTGICFIGERPFREFLQRYLSSNPGPMVDDQGAHVGEHQGLMFYTLGQRRGLHIGGRRGAREAPWYVADKRAGDNTLVVTQDPQHPLLMTHEIATGPFSWVGAPAPVGQALTARIRHRQSLQSCTIVDVRDDGALRVRFDAPQRAATPGQYLVLYDHERCLGGGEITSATRPPVA
ncbi:MAG: tRNA (5-methylaminomethyl-2-thiouridylate)-methyltransferase [Panacagrimonas sp.]|jgi:tRNA-specific 2-thiouridylase|nr:tRNA 2-thiouridine(34) synthase MnmA [Panacagrimonas sp.]MCC2658457.1 tRNA (5-methylaminomethyl-2-thiouridylate)-methyltransferase [Panacagrimonas sp.]